ncbi:hypothetical protein ISU10_11225 [Nocardioides agariphilus]|uniref:Uncharacterized protein n=1 Tax=Nocardioides agariphilus TaxID=433664 RepID=A0A930VNY4_9ACTN|nr:hypothetical protein [Nocardioides agariphilus]MBF4768338.1 hypothetical protein [Nocardioides agariphilus]
MGKRSVPRTGTSKSTRPTAGGGRERKKAAALTDREVCGKCGEVHRGCKAHTKHGPNTGKACGAQVRLGASLCPKHGGNHPAHKQAAKDRLLAMVNPALAELHRIMTNKQTSDTDKLRAIQMVLDRTGFKPGVQIDVAVTAFQEVADAALVEIGEDRSLPSSERPALDAPTFEDAEQLAYSAQEAIDNERHDADTRTYLAGRIYPDENTVRGEVMSILPDPMRRPKRPTEFGGAEAPPTDRAPTDPPR